MTDMGRPMEEMITGGIYRITCRNLSIGVYDGKGGFIGIREKFGCRYLFTEYAAETGSVLGTVLREPRTLIGQVLPGVPLEERLGPWGPRQPGVMAPPNQDLYRVLEQAEDPDPGREARLARWNRDD